jgi:hypothetical protein
VISVLGKSTFITSVSLTNLELKEGNLVDLFKAMETNERLLLTNLDMSGVTMEQKVRGGGREGREEGKGGTLHGRKEEEGSGEKKGREGKGERRARWWDARGGEEEEEGREEGRGEKRGRGGRKDVGGK